LTPIVSETPKSMTTKFGMGDEVGEKFQYDLMRGFRSLPPPLLRDGRRVQGDLASYFLGGSSYSLEPSPCTDFYDQYVKWRRFAQECALWGSQTQNFTFRPYFPLKSYSFPFSTGVQKLSRQKRP